MIGRLPVHRIHPWFPFFSAACVIATVWWRLPHLCLWCNTIRNRGEQRRHQSNSLANRFYIVRKARNPVNLPANRNQLNRVITSSRAPTPPASCAGNPTHRQVKCSQSVRHTNEMYTYSFPLSWTFSLPASLESYRFLNFDFFFSPSLDSCRWKIQVIRDRKEALQKSGTQGAAEDAAAGEDLYFGTKKRLAFLDLLLQGNEKHRQLTDDDVREEVDTFMFEVGTFLLAASDDCC